MRRIAFEMFHLIDNIKGDETDAEVLDFVLLGVNEEVLTNEHLSLRHRCAEKDPPDEYESLHGI